MEIIKKHELDILELKIEDIYKEVYDIAISTKDNAVKLQAWQMLLFYKKDLESKEIREKAMLDMMSSFSKI